MDRGHDQPGTIRFGPFAVDRRAGELRKGRTRLRLPHQSLEILCALLSEPGAVVSREHLRLRLWPSDTFVDFEHGLNAAVRRLRAALGDSAESPRFIETLPRRGYRFIGTIENEAGAATVAAPNGSPVPLLADPTEPHPVVVPAPIALDSPLRSRSAKTKTMSALNRLKWLVATVALVALAVISIRLFSSVGIDPALSGQPINSVAVLPFIIEGGDAELEYVSDGMTDRVIEGLSRVGDLRVMSHNAVFHYKGHQIDAAAIGRKLGVQAVLTGLLAKHQDSVRLKLELIDARDNSHLWGEQYDRGVHDLLGLEREIPVDISDRLRLTLSADVRRRLTQPYTRDAEAYQLYLKGRYAWEKWTVDGSKQAVAYYEEAIRKDPDYALAYAGLADAYVFGLESGAGLPRDEAWRRGKTAAIKALALDSQLAQARAALGVVLLYVDWDIPAAERELQQALALNPSYAEAHHQYSHLLLILGRTEESLTESRKFLELDPVSESPVGHLAWHYLSARDYEKSIEWSQKDLQLYPEAPQPTLFDAYYGAGMFREAAKWFVKENGRRLTPKESDELNGAFAQGGMTAFLRRRIEQLERVSPVDRDLVDIAALDARLDDKDAAFKYLGMAFTNHARGLVRLKEDVRFDNVRNEPRFADFLRRVGLPPDSSANRLFSQLPASVISR